MRNILLSLLSLVFVISLSSAETSCGGGDQSGTEEETEIDMQAQETKVETSKQEAETEDETKQGEEDIGEGEEVAEAASEGNASEGEQVYNQICASCHGESGKGDGPAAASLDPKPKDHTDGEKMSRLSDDHMFKVISEGGAAAGLSPAMPAWGGTLSDQEILDVMAYIRKDLCECTYQGK